LRHFVKLWCELWPSTFVGWQPIGSLTGLGSNAKLFLRLDKTYMLRIFSTLLMFVFAPLAGGRTDHAPLMVAQATLLGVDVSHHQKVIEWDSVASNASVDFAFVKATEGQDFVDSLFCYNWEDLKRLGIRRGAYHFFRAYGCGEDQARHFLSQVEMLPGDLVPVLDIELTDGIAPEVMVQEARIWLETIESQLGVKAIIYSNQHFYENYLAGHFEDYPLWIARYSTEKPLLNSGKNWDLWQFSNAGCIDGICKKVDLNIFPGTPAMLDRLCWYPTPVSESVPKVSMP
jgi:lysozyme